MDELVLATEAIAAGHVTRNDLRRRYVKVHRNVYVRRDIELTARDRAMAAWLWSGREAVLVGQSAAAVLGTKWLSADEPAEVARVRHPSPPGIVVRSGVIDEDDVQRIGGVACTGGARTAYDIGRRTTPDRAVLRIDALLNRTGVPVSAVEAVAERHPGARGIRTLRRALALVDPGAESPQETVLRLVLVRSGLPRPQTQIPVHDQRGRVVRRIDLGWPQWMVGVEYDGAQHFTDASHHADDIERLEFLAARGWTVVRVLSPIAFGAADGRRAGDGRTHRARHAARLRLLTEIRAERATTVVSARPG